MLDFNLNEEQAMIRDMARKFAEKEMLPAAEHYDQNDEYPWPIIKKAQKAGLISSNVPEEFGGPGLDVLGECIINEALAWACSGIQTVIMLNNLAAWPILLAGSQAGGWLRCGRHSHHGRAPRGGVPPQRLEDLDHQRTGGQLLCDLCQDRR
jgi:alkylation response protein AidB-like acyl-CoA dehydrogenase